MTHVLTCDSGGGLEENTKGEMVQMKDNNLKSGRIQAFISNEEEGIPLHLIIGTFSHARNHFV